MVSTKRLVLWVRASSKDAKDAVLSRVGLTHQVLHALVCQANQGYDPRNSLVKDNGLADFIKAPITGDLTEVVFSGGQARGYVAGRSQLAMTTTGVVWRVSGAGNQSYDGSQAGGRRRQGHQHLPALR